MATMIENLRAKLTSAMKNNSSEKDILRVVLGELSTLEARQSKVPSDDDTQKVIRKIITNNIETCGHLESHQQKDTTAYAKLQNENNFLSELLPKSLTRDEITSHLSEVAEQIKVTKSDGMAMGVAMKVLKTKQLNVVSEDVLSVVTNIRKN